MVMSNDKFVQQIKERLLPPTLVEKFAEGLLEWLPRKLYRVQLLPAKGIVVLAESEGEYSSTGCSPIFRLQSECPISAGWYYLEAALVRNNGNREAYLVGKGARSEEEVIKIPVPSILSGSVREVFFVPKNVVSLEFQPTAAPGYFCCSPVLIHRISSLESFIRRIYRVSIDSRHLRFSQHVPGSLFLWTLRNLQEAYLSSARIRLKRYRTNDYAAFIASNDTITSKELAEQRQKVGHFVRKPCISLLISLQGPTPELLAETSRTVIEQTYPEWELILAGGDEHKSPPSLGERETHCKLTTCNGKDRIRYISAPQGLSRAELLNHALSDVTGDYIAVIDQHDHLPAHALYCIAEFINQNPHADLIYTDHDEIDANGARRNPCFKPDWNPDLFFSHHYIGKLVITRHEKIAALQGFRAGLNGAEEYDLTLRYIKAHPERAPLHIPRVLYHGYRPSVDRTILAQESNIDVSASVGADPNLQSIPTPNSVASAVNASLSHQAGKQALEDYFSGSCVLVEDGAGHGLYHAIYPVPKQQPLVSIIVPTKDKVEILRNCIQSIQQKTRYENWEVLIVDNGSVEPETFEFFAQQKNDNRVHVLQYSHPFNYSAINNYAVAHARGELLALVNNDVEVISPEWLPEMVAHSLRPEIGVVGAKLLYSTGLVQHAGVILGLGGVAGHAHRYLSQDDHGYCHRAVVTQNLSAVTAACMVVRKEVYQEVGGLNEVDLKVAFNDVDFCLRVLNKGYRNLFTPYAILYHHESLSRGRDDTEKKRQIFQNEFYYMRRIWGEALIYDTAYNPNLSTEFDGFSYAFGPINARGRTNGARA